MSPENDKRLVNIRELLKRKVGEANPQLKIEENASPQAGELWLIRSDDDSDPEMVLVLETILSEEVAGSRVFHNVAPLFTETEWTGPDDFLLPPRAAGFKCAAALGLSVTIDDETFDKKIASLPTHWFNQAKGFDAALEAGQTFVPGLSAGLPYLDEKDSRLAFHESLAKRMEPFQEQALSLLFDSQEPEQLEDDCVLQFPTAVDLALSGIVISGPRGATAAATTFALAAAGRSEKKGKTLEASYQILDSDLSLRLRIERDGKHETANVFGPDGNPDQSLNGAVFRDWREREIGRIDNSQARLPAAPMAEGFSFEYPVGVKLSLKKLPDSDD